MHEQRIATGLRELPNSTQESFMNSIRHLICGIDGSDPARRAAATALRLADRLGDRLLLVHVTPARPPILPASVPVGAHPVGIADMHELNGIEADVAFESVEPDVAPASADRIIEHGDAALRLSAVAADKDARLIVVGTRGLGIARAALLGSVSAQLSGRASRPVVVVSNAEPDHGRGAGGIVCGVDGSKAAAAVAVTAGGLARALDVSLRSSVPTPRMRAAIGATRLSPRRLPTPAKRHGSTASVPWATPRTSSPALRSSTTRRCWWSARVAAARCARPWSALCPRGLPA
jgi:nucleotide-binding universal stress UspA family protein